MKPFAELLDRLLYAPQRNAKLALLGDYFRRVPDPDRGWGLAAVAGTLAFPHAKPGLVRGLAASRTDPVLFAWSHDFVGDLAETAALLWPGPEGDAGDGPRLAEVVEALRAARRDEVPGLVAGWLDGLDAAGRWALLKLVTGSLRVGASARLARLALAAHGGVDPAEVEEVWHGLAPPYLELFAWLEGRGPRPGAAGAVPAFRPLMLAHPLEDADLPRLDPAEHLAEWKWDGIRVQVAAAGGEGGVRLFSRAGDDVSAAFPEIVEAAAGLRAVPLALDGELLVGRAGEGGEVEVASFNELQQRLNRKAPTAAALRRHPAFVRLYDLLVEGGEDLRPLPLAERRARLEAFLARERPGRMDLSPLVPVPEDGLAGLDRLRREARGTPVEGLMLKRRDGPYLAGRPKGQWWKWKRDPHRLDVVVMYAQRGHGKRSSFYSDYTFGCWRRGAGGGAGGDGGDELVPVGKCYSGYTDAELARLDRWVRDHTRRRHGPVREVEPGLVLEVAFDSAHRSPRHKSGVALRFPRVARVRWDKPAAEADRLEAVERLIAG